MTQTLTALYQNRADAEAARDRLNAAGLGAHIDIHDEAATSKTEGQESHGFMEKLRAMFGDHRDTHTYAEGLRRGHILLTAKVDDLRATNAAELLNATTAMDLQGAESNWRLEGWTAPVSADTSLDYAGGDEMSAVVPMGMNDGLDQASPRVRSYISSDGSATASSAEQAGEGVIDHDTLIRGAERQSNIDIGDVDRPAGGGLGTSPAV